MDKNQIDSILGDAKCKAWQERMTRFEDLKQKHRRIAWKHLSQLHDLGVPRKLLQDWYNAWYKLNIGRADYLKQLIYKFFSNPQN